MKVYINGMSAISPFTEQGGNLKDGHFACIEPDYKEFISPLLARRMSRMVKMGVSSAKMCLRDASVEVPDAIVTGTGLGCIEDTEKFMTSIIRNEEKMLPPTSFIQSTHNTVGAQIALELKCHNYNFAYVHRGFSFETALLDSLMLLEEKEAGNVLLGSIDEITVNILTITERLGHWRKGESLNGFGNLNPAAGEGTVFLMLSQQREKESSACIYHPHMFYKPSSPQEVETEIQSFLEKVGYSINDIDLVMIGANGNSVTDSGYDYLLKNLLANKSIATFKTLCGEYHTASSFAVWLAANILKTGNIPVSLPVNHKPPMVQRILIYNHYRNLDHTLTLLER